MTGHQSLFPAELRQAMEHLRLMRTGEWTEPSWLSRAEASALHEHIVALEEKANAYRIEADCALRDCDAMELRLGLARDEIARLRPRPNYSGMGF